MSNLKETLKQIIISNQNQPTPKLVKRDLAVERIPGKATLIIVERRCEKTSYLLDHASHLLAEGLQASQICHIDFSDDRLIE